MKRSRRPRPKAGQRLRGTKYDTQVPNPGYSELIHKSPRFIDENNIYYYKADKNNVFVRRQYLAGSVSGEDDVYWTLRPIVRGAGRRRTPFPRVGERLLLKDNENWYSAYVKQDYKLPRHATGWVILSQINVVKNM